MDQNIAYRDSSFVVVKMASALPQRCYKCNSIEIMSSKEQVIEYTPRLGELLDFAVGQVVPLPLSLSLGKKEIQLKIFFCRRHRSFHRILFRLGAAILFFSVLCFAASLVTSNSIEISPILAIIFIIAFCIGLILVYIAKEHELVSRHKYQAPYFWIKGFGDEYMNCLPDWPGIA